MSMNISRKVLINQRLKEEEKYNVKESFHIKNALKHYKE